jgi:hypothetical protein
MVAVENSEGRNDGKGRRRKEEGKSRDNLNSNGEGAMQDAVIAQIR